MTGLVHFVLLVLLAAVIPGCTSGVKAPPTPTYYLLVPAQEHAWKADLIAGFQAACEQFNMRNEIREYETDDSAALITLIERLPDPRGAPVSVVFLNKEPISEIASQLLPQERHLVTIGEDNAASGRVGHVGEASERLAYIWSIRWSQMEPPPRNVLFVFGRVPATKDRLSGSLFSRSDDWRRFVLRVRTVEELSADDIEWADATLPMGPDALTLVRRMGAKLIVPVDGSDETLSLLESGEVQLAIAPSYFQMGFRAGRISREFFLSGMLQSPAVLLPYTEIVPETVDWYRQRRYDVPPAVPGAGR